MMMKRSKRYCLTFGIITTVQLMIIIHPMLIRASLDLNTAKMVVMILMGAIPNFLKETNH